MLFSLSINQVDNRLVSRQRALAKSLWQHLHRSL